MNMNKAFKQYRSLRLPVCLCVEFLLLSSAVALAAFVHFPRPDALLLDGYSYLPYAIMIAFVGQLCMYYTDLYDLKVVHSHSKLCVKLLQSIAAEAIILVVLFYLFPQLILGRGIFLTSLAIAFCLLVTWRLSFQKLQTTPSFKTMLLIVGTGEEAQELAKELLSRKSLGYEIKGFIDEDPDKLGQRIVHPKVIGTYDQILEVVAREDIDKIVVALPERRGRLPMEALLYCKLRGVDVEEGVSFYEHINGKIMLEYLRPSWIVFSRDFVISPSVKLLKRPVDTLLAITGLILAAPLMLIAAGLIKLDSEGPIFYSQKRVGQNGNTFTLIKFRSMRTDAEAATGPVYAGEHDQRITRVGKWLRLVRLDELPQLFNVFKGEMSFVGPRPERPFFVEQLQKEIPYFIQRLSVKPGITGWAQVNYPYGATTEDAMEKLQLDLFYIKNMSILLDLLILLKTLKIAVFQQGAR